MTSYLKFFVLIDFQSSFRTFEILLSCHILDFRQVWTPPRGKFSDLFVRLLPEIFDRVAFQRGLKGKFAHLHKMESNTHPRNPLSRNAARDPFPWDNAQSDIITILKSHWHTIGTVNSAQDGDVLAPCVPSRSASPRLIQSSITSQCRGWKGK